MSKLDDLSLLLFSLRVYRNVKVTDHSCLLVKGQLNPLVQMRSSLSDQGNYEFRSLAIKTTFTEFSKNCSNMDI